MDMLKVNKPDSKSWMLTNSLAASDALELAVEGYWEAGLGPDPDHVGTAGGE